MRMQPRGFHGDPCPHKRGHDLGESLRPGARRGGRREFERAGDDRGIEGFSAVGQLAGILAAKPPDQGGSRLGLPRAVEAIPPCPTGCEGGEGRGALLQQPALPQHGQMAEAVRHAGIVDRGHDRAAAELQIADQTLHRLPLPRVETAKRIVEHEHVWRMDERPPDEQELRLPGGQAVDLRAPPALQICQIECPVDGGLQHLAGDSGGAAEECQELIGPHARPRGKLRRHIAEAAPHRVGIATDGVVGKHDVAAPDRDGRGEGLHKRALASAGPADDSQRVARFFIRRLASGRLLLVKHGDKVDAHEGRVQLSAWLSDDDGQTWHGGLVLDERKGISYPDGFQAPDGTIFISYDRNRVTDGEILLARFTEADLLAKELTGPKSKLKMLISRPLAAAPPTPRSDPLSSRPATWPRKRRREVNETVDFPPLVEQPSPRRNQAI